MKTYTDVNGREANLIRYSILLNQINELTNELLDIAPVEQIGQVERAEVIQEMIAASKTAYEEDLADFFDISAA